MKRKQLHNLILLLFLVVFFSELGIVKLVEESKEERLSLQTVVDHSYREQELGEAMLTYLHGKKSVGRDVGIYLLESKFGYQKFPYPLQEDSFETLTKKWRRQEGWNQYLAYTETIWNDVKYFPVPEFLNNKSLRVTYVNSWLMERNYGGKRGHEGTDIMATKDVAGIYPIVSMTDGIVRQKGWLEKGGYRIGVESPKGAYFYYAHLDSYADIEVGDEIHAGDLLGYMGDTGYGPEGTTGQFPVHLHLGIYIYPNGQETSVNPYWVLRYAQQWKIYGDIS